MPPDAQAPRRRAPTGVGTPPVAARRRLPALDLSIQYPGGKADAPTRAQVRRYVRASCRVPAQLTLRFVAAEEGQALNRTYRGKDYATNVLSFAYECGEQLSGDLVICTAVAVREAASQGKSAAAHLAHLIVHGMLHLQGFDHETGAQEAQRMEAEERAILQRLGFADPYE